MVPINIGDTIQPWNSAPIIVCLAIVAISLIFLIYHQRILATNPAFPRSVFARPVTDAAFGSLIGGLLLSMVFYNLVLFWQGVRHLPALRVGQMLLSVTLPYAVFAALTGIAIRNTGRVRWVTFTGAGPSTLGLGLMHLMAEDTPVAALLVICVCVSAGCGIFLPAMGNTVIASTDPEWHPHAVAVRTLLSTAGQSVGISAGLAIFTNNFKYQNGKAHGGINTPQDLMQIIKDLPPEVVGLVNHALRWMRGLGCVLSVISGVVTCYYSCPKLPKDKKRGAATHNEEREGVTEEEVKQEA